MMFAMASESNTMLCLVCGVSSLCGSPYWSPSWYSSPWEWVGPSDLLGTNRIQQKWWNVTSVIRWQKTVTSILLEDALLLALMKQASCLLGKAHVMRNWGWPPDNSQQKIEGLSPTVLEETNPAFRWDLSFGWHFDCQPSQTPWRRGSH